jgi:hypothetical protein
MSCEMCAYNLDIVGTMLCRRQILLGAAVATAVAAIGIYLLWSSRHNSDRVSSDTNTAVSAASKKSKGKRKKSRRSPPQAAAEQKSDDDTTKKKLTW